MYIPKLNQVLRVSDSRGVNIFAVVKCKDKNHFGLAFSKWEESRDSFRDSCDTRLYYNKEVQADILNNNKVVLSKPGYKCGGTCLSKTIFEYLDKFTHSPLKGFTPVSIARESCDGGDYFYGIMLCDGMELDSIKSAITDLFPGAQFHTDVYINWRWYVLGGTWFPELWM